MDISLIVNEYGYVIIIWDLLITDKNLLNRKIRSITHKTDLIKVQSIRIFRPR